MILRGHLTSMADVFLQSQLSLIVFQYILHTVVTGLAFLTVLGLIVYEAVTFGSVLGLYKQSAGSL